MRDDESSSIDVRGSGTSLFDEHDPLPGMASGASLKILSAALSGTGLCLSAESCDRDLVSETNSCDGDGVVFSLSVEDCSFDFESIFLLQSIS